MKSTNVIACAIVALGLLQLAFAGSSLAGACDGRRVIAFAGNPCSSFITQTQCDIGVNTDHELCEWNGASCVEQDPIVDCTDEFNNGVDCEGTLVSQCVGLGFTDCVASHSSTAACIWSGFGFCGIDAFPCN